MSAYTSNKHLFVPKALQSSALAGDSPLVSEAKPIPGLLTLHIRQGDFREHCVNLEEWGAVFAGFNSFPELQDRLFPEGGYKTREDRKEGYRKHCFPSIEDIVAKVRQVRKDTRDYAKVAASESRSSAKWGSTAQYTELRRIYVMTNAPKDWLEELKRALHQDTDGEEQWEAIHTSRDLVLSWEQKYVAQALDMYVATRSQAFIGNGVSITCCFDFLSG